MEQEMNPEAEIDSKFPQKVMQTADLAMRKTLDTGRQPCNLRGS